LTVCAAAAFYGYAALRRVPLATAALTAALVALAVVDAESLRLDQLVAPRPVPLEVAALLQLGLGMWRRDSRRCLAGSLLPALAISRAPSAEPAPYRVVVAYHLVLAAVGLVGAAFDDYLARVLRGVTAALAFLGCLAWLFIPVDVRWGLPPWAGAAYPLAMAAALVGYGLLLRHRPSLTVAALVVVCWLTMAGWQGYRFLRQLVLGLDYIVVSLALFAVAVLISLGKAGLLNRWVTRRREEVPIAPD
jgi:hypothetical protein